MPDRSLRSAYEPLTRDNAVVLFIDLQVSPLSVIRTLPPDELRRNVLALATVARLHDVPVILIAGAQTGPGGAYLPDLLDLFPT